MNRAVLKFLIFVIFAVSCKSEPEWVAIEYRLDEARKLGEQENYEKAIQILDGVIGNYPNYPASYVLKASYMSVLPNLRKEAIIYVNKAIEIDPTNTEAYHLRGQLKDGHDAIDDFNKAIQLDSMKSGLYYSRGQVKTQLKNCYGAMDDFEKALQLDNFRTPKIKASIYGDIAIAKIQLFEYPEALENIEKAILIDSLNPMNYYIKYSYFLKTGDLAKAKENVEKAKLLGLCKFGDIARLDSIPGF